MEIQKNEIEIRKGSNCFTIIFLFQKSIVPLSSDKDELSMCLIKYLLNSLHAGAPIIPSTNTSAPRNTAIPQARSTITSFLTCKI